MVNICEVMLALSLKVLLSAFPPVTDVLLDHPKLCSDFSGYITLHFSRQIKV